MLKARDSYKLAFQNLWRQKTRTFLTILAVVIGTVGLLALLAIGFGIRNLFTKQIEVSGSQLNLVVVGESEIEDGSAYEGGYVGEKPIDQGLINRIKKIPGVLEVAPVANLHIIEFIKQEGDNKLYRYNVRTQQSNLAGEKILQVGRNFKDDNEKAKVILGAWVAQSMGHGTEMLGKKVKLVSREGYLGGPFALPKLEVLQKLWGNAEDYKERIEIEAEVIGITVNGPHDHGVYVSEGWGKELMTEKQYVEIHSAKDFENQAKRGWYKVGEDENRVFVMARDQIKEEGYGNLVVKTGNYLDEKGNSFQGKEAMGMVEREIETWGYSAITPQEYLAELLRALFFLEIGLGAIGVIALLVAALGIANTMVMAIYERTKEIGLMKALGADKKDIKRLFTKEALLIGLCGGILGSIFAKLVEVLVNMLALKIMTEQGLSWQGVIYMPFPLILIGILFVTLVGYLSGVRPAKKAAKLDPIEALRYE